MVVGSGKQGHIDAARKMGDAYRDGFGIAPDQKQADYWYEQFFAHSDNLNAYAEIGVAYSSAETPDYARAQYWWQRGAKQGNIASQYYLAWLDYWEKWQTGFNDRRKNIYRHPALLPNPSR